MIPTNCPACGRSMCLDETVKGQACCPSCGEMFDLPRTTTELEVVEDHHEPPKQEIPSERRRDYPLVPVGKNREDRDDDYDDRRRFRDDDRRSRRNRDRDEFEDDRSSVRRRSVRRRGTDLDTECPYCGSREPPDVRKEIATMGWVLFGIGFFGLFPINILGLFIKEEREYCYDCGVKIRNTGITSFG